jgi:hypothetical protein
VEASPLLLGPLNGLLYQPRMIYNDNDCGAIGGMIGNGKRNTRRTSLCPLQFPHILGQARIRAAAVGSMANNGHHQVSKL